jgi:hypothetical protein
LEVASTPCGDERRPAPSVTTLAALMLPPPETSNGRSAGSPEPKVVISR